MKNLRESNEADALLDAVLIDEHWRALEGSLKYDGLAALRVQRRKRSLRLQVSQLACAMLLLVGAVWWLSLPTLKQESVAQHSVTPAAATGEQFITEEATLAMSPRGSCVVAEVNGQKELVFFDAQMAEDGFVLGQN